MHWHCDSLRYDNWIDGLSKSRNKLLRDHFFLGIASWTGEPIFLAKDIFNEHVWVTGGSGSGKSALILAPLISQIMERRDTSILWIDQKGDLPGPTH